jgi:hypothetical protein
MVGLTGSKEKTDEVAKAYRVHVSEGPPMEGNPNDYIGAGQRGFLLGGTIFWSPFNV